MNRLKSAVLDRQLAAAEYVRAHVSLGHRLVLRGLDEAIEVVGGDRQPEHQRPALLAPGAIAAVEVVLAEAEEPLHLLGELEGDGVGSGGRERRGVGGLLVRLLRDRGRGTRARRLLEDRVGEPIGERRDRQARIRADRVRASPIRRRRGGPGG